jgi:hypothetical protein
MSDPAKLTLKSRALIYQVYTTNQVGTGFNEYLPQSARVEFILAL